jgi:peptide deformylase
MIRPLVTAPNDVLTTPAREIKRIDKQLQRIITDLKDTLIATRNPKGVGLAAPQIGVPVRVFVTRPREKDPIRVFINPVIVKESSSVTDGVPERENKLEGCLSVPAVWGRVKRSTSLTLRYQDETGEIHEEQCKGFLATIIQHETDHLNGTLFTHRVLTQDGKLYQSTKDENGKEILEEIELK